MFTHFFIYELYFAIFIDTLPVRTQLEEDTPTIIEKVEAPVSKKPLVPPPAAADNKDLPIVRKPSPPSEEATSKKPSEDTTMTDVPPKETISKPTSHKNEPDVSDKSTEPSTGKVEPKTPEQVMAEIFGESEPQKDSPKANPRAAGGTPKASPKHVPHTKHESPRHIPRGRSIESKIALSETKTQPPQEEVVLVPKDNDLEVENTHSVLSTDPSPTPQEDTDSARPVELSASPVGEQAQQSPILNESEVHQVETPPLEIVSSLIGDKPGIPTLNGSELPVEVSEPQSPSIADKAESPLVEDKSTPVEEKSESPASGLAMSTSPTEEKPASPSPLVEDKQNLSPVEDKRESSPVAAKHIPSVDKKPLPPSVEPKSDSPSVQDKPTEPSPNKEKRNIDKRRVSLPPVAIKRTPTTEKKPVPPPAEDKQPPPPVQDKPTEPSSSREKRLPSIDARPVAGEDEHKGIVQKPLAPREVTQHCLI